MPLAITICARISKQMLKFHLDVCAKTCFGLFNSKYASMGCQLAQILLGRVGTARARDSQTKANP